jgi:hypothetical protein
MLALLLFAAQAAPAQPSPAPSPAAAVAAAPAPDPSVPTPEGLEELRRSFHDSCEVRIYGEYDDMCSALADEVRHYRAALDRAERRARAPR